MKKISELAKKLQQARSTDEKIAVLDQDPVVISFFKEKGEEIPCLSDWNREKELVMKQLVAIGQAEKILRSAATFQDQIEKLLKVDLFYREMGGIVGYHAKVLSLLKQEPTLSSSPSLYHSPDFIDISVPDERVMEMVLWGLEGLPEMAEIYPLGGAADRLHLKEEATGMELPAAKLPFGGRTLFELLIRDLAARESLYFKIFGKQITTPVAIMTSLEKENDRHVREIGEDRHWFHRPQDSFFLFSQPLVPVVKATGEWSLSSPFSFLFKPGGHGAIWKLARDGGVFAWLEGRWKRKKALVRQINNPIAGLDYGLLAFTGVGWKREMKFGFASCPRLLRAAEGVNVLIERRKGEESSLVLTNVEYCDFAKFGIEDAPLKEGEPFSRFSSNTNILFADLNAVKEAVDQSPFPGLILNLKTGISVSPQGERQEEVMARLESTMQNIGDVFIEPKKETLSTERTFVTYNHRHKTIATAKKAYVEGGSLQETPENCFYELLRSARELLEIECGFSLPPERNLFEYLEKGPPFVFLYHPALGPLYSIIRQKIERGRLGSGSLLHLEIGEILFRDLDLEGSLRVIADQVMGHQDEEGVLRYSDQVGRCILNRVTVRNQGVAWERSRPFWRGEFHQLEGLEIRLKGRSEFVAENVCFEGNFTFEVEEGTRLIVGQEGGKLQLRKERLEETPLWSYSWDRSVVLKREAAHAFAAS